MFYFMKLEFGSEKRFFDFVEGLNDEDKVALISHIDLDGVAAAKVVNEAVKGEVVKFVNYEELNDGLVQTLRERKINKIIFTDLYIGSKEFLTSLESFAHVLILDHHIASEDWNSSKTVFIKVEEGYCATYLSYYLFSKVKNIEYLDWLVAGACIADYCHIKVSDWLSRIYEKYEDSFEIQETYVRRSGKVWDLQEALSLTIIYFKDKHDLNYVLNSIGCGFGEVGDLYAYATKVRGEIDLLVRLYQTERLSFPGGYLYEFSPNFGCGGMVSTILSGQDSEKIVITGRPGNEDDDSYYVSLRLQSRKQNMNDFLKKLLEGIPDSDGGGHIAAAGGHFPKRYLGEIKRRLGIEGLCVRFTLP